jgi:hypothetical protein
MIMKKSYSFLLFIVVSLGWVLFAASVPDARASGGGPTAGNQDKPAEKKGISFDEIVKDAKKLSGLFNLYLKEDKVFLEIAPEQLKKTFLFVPTLWTSIGRGGAGSYLPLKVLVWEKRDKKLLLKWRSPRYQTKKSLQYQRALENVVSDSIVASFKLESEPHPEKKSLLICLDDGFFSDLVDLAAMFSPDREHAYVLDKSRTVWGKVLAFPKNVELETVYTLASSRPPSQPTVPDPRTLTVRVRYSLSEVPADNGYRPRVADDRIGYFHTKIYDFDRLDLDGTTVRYINRWFLEKKDPGQKISEPKEPIIFWLENAIPPEYRKPIGDGILEWNKAFERIGFQNALVVREMPDDAAWDPADVRYNTIRWIPSLTGGGGGAMGPSRVNPFTGQILDADVTIRAPLSFYFSYEVFNRPLSLTGRNVEDGRMPGQPSPFDLDNLFLGMERDYGILEMLASGRIRNVKEVPQEYIYDAVKQLACHEVGHTLGLRHNFKGSMTIALEDLHNREWTGKESIGNSIMEYLPANLAPQGERQGDYFQKTLGDWDYWVIEYGYTPVDAASPDEELPVLGKIAARSVEPGLIYGTDEDAYDVGPFSDSIDPSSVTFDLSGDPLGYSIQEIQRIKDLWKQLEDRALFDGLSFVYLRQAFESSLARYSRAIGRAAKWIGGVYHSRVHVGDSAQELPFRVVEAEKQKRALDIIRVHFLESDAFSFRPDFLRKLQVGRFNDFEDESPAAGTAAAGNLRMEFSLTHVLKQVDQNILALLYDPLRLSRILDNPQRTEGETLALEKYLETLYRSIWRELEEGRGIGPLRRILQREHLAKMTNAVLKPSPVFPDDALAILRYELKALERGIAAYFQSSPQTDLMTRAHLEDCANLVSETLKAVSIRTAK